MTLTINDTTNDSDQTARPPATPTAAPLRGVLVARPGLDRDSIITAFALPTTSANIT